jgi:hypothetical protein
MNATNNYLFKYITLEFYSFQKSGRYTRALSGTARQAGARAWPAHGTAGGGSPADKIST